MNVEMVDGAGDFRLLSRRTIHALLELKENNRFSKGLFSWVGFNQIYIEYENQERAGGSEDFLTIDMMNAYEKLGLIIGEEVEDDLADRIFEKFCMGK